MRVKPTHAYEEFLAHIYSHQPTGAERYGQISIKQDLYFAVRLRSAAKPGAHHRHVPDLTRPSRPPLPDETGYGSLPFT